MMLPIDAHHVRPNVTRAQLRPARRFASAWGDRAGQDRSYRPPCSSISPEVTAALLDGCAGPLGRRTFLKASPRKRYWPRLFGKTFRRTAKAEG